MIGYDFSDVKFKLENNRRHRIKNNIHIADVIDGNKIYKETYENPNSFPSKHDMYYYVKKIGELDFYQEISGFFHTRKKVYVQKGLEQFAIDNVPANIDMISGLSVVAGDYVVDREFNVYRITGWDNQNNSEHYFDFIDGSGSEPLYRLKNGTITNNWILIKFDKDEL